MFLNYHIELAGIIILLNVKFLDVPWLIVPVSGKLVQC
jgi:hypothetical protein